ncbi:MAG: hypothetical protein JRI72_07505 [Deltaproteobacteria bacterium]|nr:hypothetical protein [Deltaproteobacteria bacterium]
MDIFLGRFYDKIFESRHKGDYHPMVGFESKQVKGYTIHAMGAALSFQEFVRKPKARSSKLKSTISLHLLAERYTLCAKALCSPPSAFPKSTILAL